MRDLTAVLERLEAVLGPCRREPIPLDGGITNRNFRVLLGEREYVVRLPGKDTALLGIDRESERLAAERAAALGIGPELAYADEDCVVTVFLGAAPAGADAIASDPAPVAAALRAFHHSGLVLPTRFWVPDLLAEYARLVEARGARLPAAFRQAQALAARVAEVLPLDMPVPCHDDLLPGNVLLDGERLMLVDWEYAGMGHPLFDLANLAAGHELAGAAEARLLEAYFGAPPPTGRRAALKLMRIVSDAREAAWGVVQALISELDFDFAGYAEQHFERLERAAADPNLEDWLHAATA